MVSRIGSTTNSSFVVTIHRRKRCKNVEVSEQISKPSDFSSHRCKGFILNFCSKFADCRLFLGFPADQRVLEEYVETGGCGVSIQEPQSASI